MPSECEILVDITTLRQLQKLKVVLSNNDFHLLISCTLQLSVMTLVFGDIHFFRKFNFSFVAFLLYL